MLLFLILLVLHSVLAHEHQRPENKIFYSEDDAQFHFESFLKTNNKIYKSELEKATRFKIFKENLLKINEMNRKDPHATFAVNKFSDLSSEEFLKTYTGLRLDLADSEGPDCANFYDNDFIIQNIPEAFDWRFFITMTVRNQMDCASSWAFAATGNVEAQYALATNNTDVLLSEQQLVDCHHESNGCGGGDPSNALRYLVQVGGQETDKAYPYSAKKSRCVFRPDMIRVNVYDCFSFHLTNESMIQQVLFATGPLIVVFDADSMKQYDSGVLTNCFYKYLNHVALLVGYGTDNGTDYWIIKNSWGVEWGENGYIRIARNINACGILNPIIATALIETI